MTNEEKSREIQANDVCCVWNGGCPNVRIGAMKMAQWKDEEHAQDMLFIEDLKSRCDFYKNFIDYLHNECFGAKDGIIDAVSENLRTQFIGYVETEKEINNKGDLVFKFKIDDKTYKATWQQSDNYAVCQWTGFEADDYMGYLLFPTFDFKKFFCVWYQC